MGDLSSASTKDSNGHVTVDIPEQRPVLHRVPTQVREGKNQIYEPVLVSLGPYHHDPSRFKQVEDLKGEILDDLVPREKLLEKIQSRLDDIRSFYGGLSRDECDDATLAEMMLRDACFLVYFMKNMGADDEKCIIRGRLGMSRVAFVVRDFFMLENQLPFWILKLLMTSLTFDAAAASDHDDHDHGNNGCEAFFYELLSSMINCGDSSTNCLQRLHWDDRETLHLLHARLTALVQRKEISTTTETIKKSRDETKKKTTTELVQQNESSTTAKAIKSKSRDATTKKVKSQFRSVKDLKAKGIHFRPSSSCLKDIQFSSHSFYGKLRLPILSMDKNTNVIFSNIIALEMSPGSHTDFAVISYVKFMKSLIEKPEDVKELREKGIILSCLVNDEEVVKMFKEFNTDGSCSKDIFQDIRERINDHCSSKAKTFKAELIHTYFRSPWTAIALFVATLLLFVNCFNFFLNYYRMRRPIKRD